MGYAPPKDIHILRERIHRHANDDHLIESGCSGITTEDEEFGDRDAPYRDHGLVGGFQHNFDVDASRTDSATTVHSLQDLLDEAS